MISSKALRLWVSAVVSVYLWFTSLVSLFLLRETWLRVVTAQHLFSFDIRQTDGLLLLSGLAAWCRPPASIRIGLTSALSSLTYMAMRNGPKLPSEQPLGPPWIPAFLILKPSSTMFPWDYWVKKKSTYLVNAVLCTVTYIWSDNMKHWHEQILQLWEEEEK